MTTLQSQVSSYLHYLNEGRIYAQRGQPQTAKANFDTALATLNGIPGGIITVNTVTEMNESDQYERRHIGPQMMMRQAINDIA